MGGRWFKSSQSPVEYVTKLPFFGFGIIMAEVTTETEHYFEEQFLEKSRKKLWSDIMQYPVETTDEDQVAEILSELESAHRSHGKPLRLVKIRRVVTTEIEVVKVFESTKSK